MASPDDTRHKAEEAFLGELKLQFNNEVDLKKTVDTKTSTLITISGSIATLNIAIGTFLIARIQDHNWFYFGPILILCGGILLSMISTWKFTSSYGVRDYKYPFGHEFFFDKNGSYESDKVQKVRDLSEREFKDRVFKSYLESIKTFAKINKDRSSKMRERQKYLTRSIAAVGVQVIFIIILVGLGYIVLD